MIKEARKRQPFCWKNIACWVVGIYLVADSLSRMTSLYLGWSMLQDLQVDHAVEARYLLLLAWLFKLATGICFLIRSKWVLVTLALWTGFFVFYIVDIDTWQALLSEFFLALTFQGCLVWFAVWLHRSGYLKR